MPRTRSLAWSELKIGVITIAALALAALLIFTLTGSKGFFWQRYPLKTRFADVAGLASGSPVRMAGVQVGSVRRIEFAGDQVDVIFEVNKENRPRITDRSTAVLGSVSLLGTSAVDITPSTQGTPLSDWAYVRPLRPRAAIADVAEQANMSIIEVSGMLQDLRKGKGTVGKLLTEDQLYTELREFVASAGQMTRELQQGRGTIGKLLKDPKAANSLEASMKNVEDITRRISAGDGTLGKLLNDDAFATSLNGATSNLKELTDRLNRGDGTAGKLITDDSLFNHLNSVTDRFNQLVTKLNDGQGTVGQLLKDKQLYENMNGAVGDFRALMAEIKKDPKKYLNVRVSIF
jgi:phospholipid/cholesterol/gamma-HCH transport system substrate-binding protein